MRARCARTVIGYKVCVAKVSVDVKGFEREYVVGADRDPVTFGGVGCELSVLKMIVSLLTGTIQVLVDLGGADSESLDEIPGDTEACPLLAGQCDMIHFRLKRNSCF
jgi:hypothetical protein